MKRVKAASKILDSEGVLADAAYLTAQQQNYDMGGTALTSGTNLLEAQTKSGANGTTTLYDKITALNSGAQAVTSGANSLADGASQVSNGIAALDKQMVTGGSVSYTLYDKISALNSGAKQVKSGQISFFPELPGLGSCKVDSTILFQLRKLMIDSTQQLKQNIIVPVIKPSGRGQADFTKDSPPIGTE